MSGPLFSILHPTVRLPDGWMRAAEHWFRAASHPEDIEYLLTIDVDDLRKYVELQTRWHVIQHRIIINHGRHCYVDAQNTAAREARGQWLICAADDWFAPRGWDDALRALDPTREIVVDVENGHHPNLVIYPIMSRAYYERPGRGGCPNGELFYPEYLSMGSDDDLTEYARRDRVIVRLPLTFEHRHIWRGIADHDTHGAYAHVQSSEAWAAKDRILPRRRAEGFSR